MARKLPRLQRALDAPALASVAYGEIASSIYFALGIVALHALGLTPVVLAVVGLIFLIVTASYVEGTTAYRGTGGAAAFVRVAFNDFAGFLTGWALFLDYLIVISLSALFLPHYLGLALGINSIARHPGDVIFGCVVIAGIAVSRLVARTKIYTVGFLVSVLDLVTQLMLVVLGFICLFSPHALREGLHLGTSPSWHQLTFAVPLAFLAYTGLETVANLAGETREPGRDLPRSFFSAIGAVVVVTVLIALVGLSAFPAANGTTELGTTWQRAPLMGIVYALGPHVGSTFEHILRVFVGLTGALILLTAAITSNSGFGRLAFSLGEHGQLPRAFARLSRRSMHSSASVLAAGGISMALLIATSFWTKDAVAFLASLFSFGVLLAFTAAQLAVIKLRFRAADVQKPYRVPFSVRLRGADVPIPTVIGAIATAAIFVAAMVTHIGARYAGPAWLAAGTVVFLVVRRRSGTGLLEHVAASAERELPPEAAFSKILVPMKLGDIGEEMIATAVKLAQERSAGVVAIHVIRVPLDQPLDAELADDDERAAESLAEAEALGRDLGVEVEVRAIRARSIGEAIVQAAEESGADLIVLGSSPRWRRQSRFFSPTVDYVLRKAPAEVLVVAFPQGVLEEA
jgi:APA family basic amino acid/polyamine antiporter